MTRRPNSRPQKRRGFTLIELLVVISIIAVLMSLILPAIQNAREAGRRTECLNNIRNLGLAMHNYATTNRGRLPSYGYFINDPSVTSGLSAVPGRSWVVELLPYIDQSGLSDRWNNSVPWFDNANAVAGSTETNAFMAQTVISVLRCASATDSNQKLSYVVNAGFGNLNTAITTASITADPATGHSFQLEPFDFNIDMTLDPTVQRDCGVFWADIQATNSSGESQTLDSFYDGAGNTIMISESLNAGATPVAGGTTTSWANPDALNCTFFFPFLQGSSLLAPQFDPMVSGTPYINQTKAGPVGNSPFLSSNHPGQVMMATGEGTARALNEDVDRTVYVRLITPSATRLRTGFTVERPVDGGF